VLEVRRLGIREPILTGVTGASLAFGVGHLDGTPLPGEKPAPAPSGGPGAPPRRPVGQAILAGHRDRAFAFLKDLRPGDRLSLRAARGSAEYVVRDTAVVRHDRFEYPDPTLPGGLVLVTCHPFGGVLRTPWRYVVRAARVGPDRALRPRAPPPPRHAPNGTPRGAPPAPPRSPGPWEDRRPV
jgi:sortase A